MKLLSIYLGICLFFMVGCSSTPTSQLSSNKINSATSAQISSQEIKVDEKLKIATGQTVYVPIYSEIYQFDKSKTLQLAATLSVRNTDPQRPIIITSVKYYDSDGNLVREHLNNPLQLAPLASTAFIVDQNDRTGGSGANFLVEWIAETEVYDPIIEALMVNTSSQQGISFISQGRVIENKSATDAIP
ncbi:MAG: DUF3124 domain-containing protein [Xenococcus sp. (in: cyanobacteria)]